MTEAIRIGDMSVGDFKTLISDIIDEKLVGHRLVHIDEQGYTYVFTEESLLPLESEFEAGLEESIRQGQEGQWIDQNEVWSKLGI